MKAKKNKNKIFAIPANLIKPVAGFLRQKLTRLESNKKKIEKEDPFKLTARVTDNAAPDTEAEEQFGHARTFAIREELERKIIQTRKALARVKIGKYGICEECGQMIDTERLMVYPEATLCARDAAKREK